MWEDISRANISLLLLPCRIVRDIHSRAVGSRYVLNPLELVSLVYGLHCLKVLFIANPSLQRRYLEISRF